MRIPFLMIAALALASASVDAQQSRSLRGIVTDSAGYPLPNVDVRIMELGRMTRSDVQGKFAIERITAALDEVSTGKAAAG